MNASLGLELPAEQRVLEQEQELNANFSIYKHPTLADYYANLNSLITLTIFLAALLTILNIAIYSATVTRLRRQLSKQLLWPSVAMVSIYPIISLAALMTQLLPYSWFIFHTVMHVMFMMGGPIFRTLLFRYVDSEHNYLKQSGGEPVQLNTPPCCCCCLCLPLVVATKIKLDISRYMVWQMPVVQGAIMLVMNLLYYGDYQLYHRVMLFFIPFIIASVVMGVWSLQVTVRMITKLRGDYQLRKKMFCLQLVVMLCKLQYLLLYDNLNAVPMGGAYPMNHTIYKQSIINIIILIEMLLVSMMAQSAYRTPSQIPLEEEHKKEQTITRI